MSTPTTMTRDEFLFRYGWKPDASDDLEDALREYGDSTSIRNEYLAGIVFERYGCYQQPGMTDYTKADEQWRKSRREFDLFTSYDSGPDDIYPGGLLNVPSEEPEQKKTQPITLQMTTAKEKKQ